jgi:uncharacterized protein
VGTEENRAIIERFYELMNSRRFEQMWALCSSDAQWGGGGNPPKGMGSIERMRQIIVDPMPIFVGGGIQFTLHAMTAENDRVAAEVESYAELTNGGVYNNHYHMLFVLRERKIVEIKEYGDTLHARRVFVDSGMMTDDQLGLGATN